MKTIIFKNFSIKDFEKRADSQAVSSHHLRSRFDHVLIMYSSGRRSAFVGNSALLPSDIIEFVMLTTKRLLTGNIFIVRSHVTLK